MLGETVNLDVLDRASVTYLDIVESHSQCTGRHKPVAATGFAQPHWTTRSRRTYQDARMGLTVVYTPPKDT